MFTPSGIPGAATVTWDYENGGKGPFTSDTSHVFSSAGAHTVTMRVMGPGDAVTDHQEVVEVNDPLPPTAAFNRSLEVPLTGQDITFTSTSTASSGELSEQSWDLNEDRSFGDRVGDTATASFATPGIHIVQLRVTQTNGASDVAEMFFRVNAPPVPGFVWSPSSPVGDGPVELISTSVDAEGPLQSQDWDLDGDGQFDDASGPSATHSFDAGAHVVTLRATDSDGVVRTLTQTIAVGAPAPLSSPLASSPLGRLSALVRLNGIVLKRGARIKVLSVRAPLGATVTARCSGRGCPRRSQRRTSVTGRLRLGAFERVLPAGVQLELFVRAPGVIGKYTRFLIRAGKTPIRTERCLLPGVSKPVRCPS